jgi:HEAT repeat protein
VPDSETALQKEVTPFSAPADATGRLLRAAAVVCRDATAVLINGLQNADPVIQAEAVTVARSLGGKVAQNVLRWAIQHGAPQAQLAAVQHLGELARPDAMDELVDLLNRTKIVEVQRECCLAFGKLSLGRAHHEKVVPVLASCLRPGGLLRTEYHEDVRAAAAFALGQMKSLEAARKALENALEDKVPRVRRTAQLMLEGK